MTDVPLICSTCGKAFMKRKGDYNKQLRLGQTNFFCSYSCSVRYGNSLRTDLKHELHKVCPVCDAEFTTMSGKGEASFCSRSCASKGSVTDYRRAKAREMGLKNCDYGIGSIESIAAAMRNREAPNYIKLADYLQKSKVAYTFEYPLGSFIFDLALPDKKLLIEFDGVYHESSAIKAKDKLKSNFAVGQGWTVCRVPVEPGIISAATISKFI